MEDQNAYPLHKAAIGGNKEMVEELLKAGLDVNSRNKAGATPLHWARSVDICELLIKAGAEVDARTDFGLTALHVTAELGEQEVCRCLIKAGADVNVQDSYDWIPLEKAAHNGYKEICETFLQAHSQIGNSLYLAAAQGNATICQILLSAGANVNVQVACGNTPLYVVAGLPDREKICEMLLKTGANVNGKHPEFGATALHCAAWHGMSENINILLRHNADITVLTSKGKSVVELAQERGHTELADYLRNLS